MVHGFAATKAYIGNLLSWRVRRVCIASESAGARALLAELDDVNGSAAALCVFVLPAERERINGMSE
jgi:hypothetical protein